MKIKPKELTATGLTADAARSVALAIVARHCKHSERSDVLGELARVAAHPEQYYRHPVWGRLAVAVRPEPVEQHSHELLPEPGQFAVFGAEGIGHLVLEQMRMAMRLPVTVAGALMADGHAGYGLPIGGVLATRGVVIPYAVGLDIGCRMQLTVLDAPAEFIDTHHDRVVDALMASTAFGMEGVLPSKHYHDVMDGKEFTSLPWLRALRAKAVRQLGSSGGGNHFVDVCEVRLPAGNPLGLLEGRYVGILSHSGSRGLGAAIAERFTTIAKTRCRLPRVAGPFAWLELDSEAGREYWHCMELAGQYARACHDIIHEGLWRALRLKPLTTVANHHNYAWIETMPDGSEVVVHRKGATPAHAGELGLIPGSMTQAGYIVQGKGCHASLCSASHGAGRRLSREEARNSVSRRALADTLKHCSVTLIGGSTEEAPQAYKDLGEVMQAQSRLVDIVATIVPRVVRMND